MNRRKLKNLKMIAFICIIVLFMEICYFTYQLFINSSTDVYFEGVNALSSTDSYYVAVGSNNDNSNHYEKAKISKYDKKRQKTFEKLYNVGYNSAFFGVVIDEDDLIAVGSYEKDEDDHNDSIRRALIVKYDKDGNIIFENDFQILDNSKFTSIVKVDDGYLVSGQSIYKNTKVGSKNGGAILVKYDRKGDLLWSKTYGSSKCSIFNDLIVLNDRIYVVGVNDYNVGVLVQYDLDGNYLNSSEYQKTDSLGFSGIVSFNDSIYVSGSIDNDSHNHDAIIAQYDFDGNFISQVVYVGDGNERFHKLVVDDHDSIVAIGTMAIPKKENGISEYNYDGIVAKYDKNLKYVDSVSYGDDRDDYFTDIIYKNDGYLVVGYSSYEDGSYMSKFIRYSRALKVLSVE